MKSVQVAVMSTLLQEGGRVHTAFTEVFHGLLDILLQEAVTR